MHEYQPLNTAVLFLVFNRLDTTTQVFEEIRKAQPPRLYVASDGPRDSRENEQTVVDEVRDFILANIDWPCEIETLFREKNLGCKIAVSSAIDWFFEHEESGIILEDDCLPDPSFFRFCEEMLVKYDTDERIMHVTGNNQVSTIMVSNSYSYTKHCSIWGWATWRRAWEHYDVGITSWKKPNIRNGVLSYFYGIGNNSNFINIFDNVYNGLIDTWDYQWVFSIAAQSGLSVMPSVNLIKNIGHGHPEAVHTASADVPMAKLVAGRVDFPLATNRYVVVDNDLDHALFRAGNLAFSQRLYRFCNRRNLSRI